MIYDRFNEKIAIKSRDSVSQPTWGGPGYVGKTGTHSIVPDALVACVRIGTKVPVNTGLG